MPTPPTRGIVRRARLDHHDFVREHLRPRVPVIITGALDDWPALRTWTPASFRSRFGRRPVRIDGKLLLLGEYLDSLDSPARLGALGLACPYLRNEWLADLLPELVGDLQIPIYAAPNWLESAIMRPFVDRHWRPWIELFIGPAGVRFESIHVDVAMTHAWIAQIYGRKKYWAWPPAVGQSPLRQAVPSTDRNIEARSARADAYEEIIEPGELLFIPAGWWHTAEIVTTSISLSGNFVNRSNGLDFARAVFRARRQRGLARVERRRAAGRRS